MRACDLVEGESYRLKDSSTYGWVRVLKVLKPKQSIYYTDVYGHSQHDTNQQPYIIVKCEHTISKSDIFGFIRYFKPVDIIKESSK